MTTEVTQGTAQLLRGRIQSLRKTRCRRDFVFTASDRTNMGATAIAAGLAGLGGVAAGLGGMAMDTTEEADLLEFELNGTQIKAWVWVSVFNEGDEVEVVAEPGSDGWMGFGIRRVSDRIVALHPHCSRGRYAHYKASFSWFLKFAGALLLVLWALLAIEAYFKSLPAEDIVPFVLVCLTGGFIAALIYGVIAFRIAKRFMGFVSLAEGIFQVFGWQNVKDIDLPGITKKTKTPSDPGALGILYFRY
ncbi:putative type VI secretion system effector [Robbsia andropogonis]|uniref:putative type VI secretion system effector n=1 Tax=Robbsia andropogonis TaxID=28092 RepID=UPI0004656258|nr:putative type VI secretion system effector [Robbsia andropogonis]